MRGRVVAGVVRLSHRGVWRWVVRLSHAFGLGTAAVAAWHSELTGGIILGTSGGRAAAIAHAYRRRAWRKGKERSAAAQRGTTRRVRKYWNGIHPSREMGQNGSGVAGLGRGRAHERERQTEKKRESGRLGGANGASVTWRVWGHSDSRPNRCQTRSRPAVAMVGCRRWTPGPKSCPMPQPAMEQLSLSS